MNLKEKIASDMKVAMKNRDELKLSVLRMLQSAVHNKEIEKKGKTGGGSGELSEEEIILVFRSEIKKRRDAAAGFAQGGRKESAEKETHEAEILQSYLPQELSDAELEKIAQEVVSGMGEVSIKDFGRVMGEVMKRVKGQASGDRVSRAVKIILEK
ncbi:GatB/YqeY domain-containing protein [Patescibacteria group bacterium]|nr:GatB/YqeY domain-containing protein [Patescibacteria group bacterium]